MQSHFTTNRLSLSPLTLAHDEFIHTLVNTPGWLRFIGDRNVHSKEDAQAYINRINNTRLFPYWVVNLQNEQQPIGIITLVKRDYLDSPDLGFAFMPEYCGAGYAFEAAIVIKDYLLDEGLAKELFAITIPDNISSIKLLIKLGFSFQREIEINGDTLSVYQHQSKPQ